MPDAGRQIWKIRVPKDVELTPLENRNEQEQNKDELREMENQRKNNEIEPYNRLKLLKHNTHTQSIKFNKCMDARRNVNTKIVPFIPKHERKHWTALVTDFLFSLFSVDFNKSNELVNNN